MKMHIDIVIPVYKPDEKFKALLMGLADQTVKPDNLIIMYTKTGRDDRFPDELRMTGAAVSCSDASGGTGFKVYELEKSEFDHGGTRAMAAEKSGADILVYMTMDAVPADKHMLEKLTGIFEEDDMVGAAYARQLPSDSSSPAERFTRGFNYPDKPVLKGEEDLEKLGIKTFFCSNVCAAYRKDIYDKLGGFVRKTIFNEDMIYAHKLIMNGYKIYYAADAGVIHTHEYTPMQQLHRNFDLAVSQAMHPEVFGSVSSESEGVRYIRSAYAFFKKEGKPYLIIPFVWGCCFRYLGYFLGKRYRKLPEWLIKACAMNKEFFECL